MAHALRGRAARIRGMPSSSREAIYDRLCKANPQLRSEENRAVFCMPDWLKRAGLLTASRLLYFWLHGAETKDYGAKGKNEGQVPGADVILNNRAWAKYSLDLFHFRNIKDSKAAFDTLFTDAEARLSNLFRMADKPLDPRVVADFHEVSKSLTRVCKAYPIGQQTPTGDFGRLEYPEHNVGYVDASGISSYLRDSLFAGRASDLTASLGSYGIKMYLAGSATRQKANKLVFVATHKGFRFFDYFDFSTNKEERFISQPLGIWSKGGDDVTVPYLAQQFSQPASAPYASPHSAGKGEVVLTNRSFRNFREMGKMFNDAIARVSRLEGQVSIANLKCKDFVVFSKMAVYPVSPSWKIDIAI
jgi:hypothetical protein